MQPNNNRAPGEAGQPDEQDTDQAAFTPGASFSNDPSDLGEAGELPSWLRNFAGSTGEGQPSSPPATPASDSEAPSSSWDDPTAAQAAMDQPHVAEAIDPAVAFGQVPDSSGDGFFSEDDLPEWLRALSNDSEPAASAAPELVGVAQPAAATGAIQVPPVARAWVTASDMPEVSAGAHLLSSLVEAIDSRPEAVATTTSSAPRPAAAAPAASASESMASAPAPASKPAAAAPATATETPAARTGGWNRTRMLAIAAIIIIVLFIIILLAGG